jgi:hypothetical protein
VSHPTNNCLPVASAITLPHFSIYTYRPGRGWTEVAFLRPAHRMYLEGGALSVLRHASIALSNGHSGKAHQRAGISSTRHAVRSTSCQPLCGSARPSLHQTSTGPPPTVNGRQQRTHDERFFSFALASLCFNRHRSVMNL